MHTRNGVNSLLVKKLTAVEKTCNSNAQYTRKETIELSGSNPDTPDNEVERNVLLKLSI